MPVGFAIYFFNFSTFIGRPGLYLEDLFVVPEMRGRGIGTALLSHLAKEAVERGCKRMEWTCLDWNTNSLEFYHALGAVPMDEWTNQRMTGEALQRLAEGKVEKPKREEKPRRGRPPKNDPTPPLL